MEEQKGLYIKLIQSIRDCFYEIKFDDFNRKKFVALGTNLTAGFDSFMKQTTSDKNSRFVILQDGMLPHIKNRWNEEVMTYVWNDRYSVKMLKEDSLVKVIKNADYFVFFSAHHWSLRDMNIIELGIEYEKQFGGRICCYDFVEEKLYGYHPIEKYYAGMTLYQDINDYMERA